MADSLFFTSTTAEEVRSAIDNIRFNKAPGHDDVPIKAEAINNSFATGNFQIA